MKVGIVYYRYPVYEGGSHIQDFVNKLTEKSEKVVLVSAHHPKVKLNPVKNLNIIWIPHFQISIIDDIVFAVSSFILMVLSKDFREVDVLNIVCVRGIPSGYLFSKIFHKPIVVTLEIINNPEVSIADKIIYKTQQILISKLKFNKIICWSKYHFNKYLSVWGIIEQDVEFIGNGINPEVYKPTVNGSIIHNKYSNGRPLIVFAKPLYCYNFLSVKIILEVIHVLSKEKIIINVLLGDGQFRHQTEEIIKKLNLNGQIYFMPFVSMNEIPKYISASDIILMPYGYEVTVSRSLLEAMSTGKAIVTTNSGEIPYILSNLHDSIICDNSTIKLAQAVKYLLTNSKIRIMLERNARRKILKYYTFDSVCNKTIITYKRVIDEFNKNR